jgi:hypothetical protein
MRLLGPNRRNVRLDSRLRYIGIDDDLPFRKAVAVTPEQARAERFAKLLRAVYLTFHRRDQLTHLERDGLLEREIDPGDRRRTLIWHVPAANGSGRCAAHRERPILRLLHR